MGLVAWASTGSDFKRTHYRTAVVQIENEARNIKPGDLVYIPPNARHLIYPTGDRKIRALCFAASYQPEGGLGYVVCDLEPVQPT